MSTDARHGTDPESVLSVVASIVGQLLEEYGLDDTEITMDTKFHDDLELESIDLVTLNGHLREVYGDRVNFAEFIADKDLDEIIALTVGELVEHVSRSLREADPDE